MGCCQYPSNVSVIPMTRPGSLPVVGLLPCAFGAAALYGRDLNANPDEAWSTPDALA